MNIINDDETTIASWVIVISNTLDELGFNANEVLTPLGLDKSKIEENPTQRIAISTMTKLWRKITQLTNRKDIGFLVAQQVQPQHFKGLGFAILVSDTLRDCFERIATYSDSISNSVNVQVEPDIDGCALSIFPKPNIDIATEAIDAFMLVIHRIFMQILNVKNIEARIDFCCDSRGISSKYLEQFSTKVYFNQNKNRYYLTNADLDKKLILADKPLAQQNDLLVKHYISQINETKKSPEKLWLENVNAEIMKGILQNQLSAKIIASLISTSERSLRRKLSTHGISFNKLVAQNKKDLAIQWLTDSDKSITDISFLLGYTDTSNFTRAFKKWFAIAPSAYKNKKDDRSRL
jgi:AraC-like DNA-binding protein